MVRIEIELHGTNVQEDIYDLRNYLKEKMPEADFVLKEQPPLPGQMSGGAVESLMGGLTQAFVSIVLEEVYQNLLKPLYNDWKTRRKQKGSQLEIMSSLTHGGEKAHFLEDSNGRTETYNFKYAIDTDKTYALLIGAGKFSSDFHSIPPVKGNLEDLFRLLTDKKHIGIPRENVFVSFNESHVEIQKQLLQAGRRQNIHTLIVYFAGHGHRSDIKKLSLIASDTEKIGDEIIGGIDFDFVSNKVMKNSAARQKILILDTCHSGIATQGEDDLTLNFDVKGSYILASSPGDDVSYFEKNARHTCFTGALLDVLETGVDNTSDMLTLEDLYNHTREVLAEKKFPVPHAKNELNIPPSNFFIARNPSFSSDKLKWRAYNLLRDGKLEEAMDEYRMLLKQFPADENLRRQYEECETELSFSRLVREANTLFYQQKNYAKAAVLYQKAYRLKKDAMVMEQIRQCEQTPTAPPGTGIDTLASVKNNTDFIAFKKAYERKAFYSAWTHLKKVKQAYPENSYVNEELLSIENKLQEIADGRKDERLNTYYSYLDQGILDQALAELKAQVRNDPEHPVFLQLQLALRRQIKERQRANDEEKDPLLFRLFKTFNTRWKAALLIILAVLIVTIVVLWVKQISQTGLAELRTMLVSNPDKAVELLETLAKKDDSGKLVLGDYYLQKENYREAYAYYDKASLPAAKSAMGKRYLNPGPGFDVVKDTSYAIDYFKQALKLGKDTTASLYLGLIALDKYNQYEARINDETRLDLNADKNRSWESATQNFKAGIADNCISCKTELSAMNFKEGDTLYKNKNYDHAYPYLVEAARYENVGAMVRLGYMFNQNSWKGKYNRDTSMAWCRAAMRYNNAYAFQYYAYLLLDKAQNNPSFYDSIYYLLHRSRELDPSPALVYNNLGGVFEKGGYKILKNLDSAKFYYRIAAGRGDQTAKDNLKRLGESTY